MLCQLTGVPTQPHRLDGRVNPLDFTQIDFLVTPKHHFFVSFSPSGPPSHSTYIFRPHPNIHFQRKLLVLRPCWLERFLLLSGLLPLGRLFICIWCFSGCILRDCSPRHVSLYSTLPNPGKPRSSDCLTYACNCADHSKNSAYHRWRHSPKQTPKFHLAQVKNESPFKM